MTHPRPEVDNSIEFNDETGFAYVKAIGFVRRAWAVF